MWEDSQGKGPAWMCVWVDEARGTWGGGALLDTGCGPCLAADPPPSVPSTIADPQELAGPGQDPDPEPECALRQLPEASAEARQCPHLPRTEGRGRESWTAPPGPPSDPPGLAPIQTPSLPALGLSPSPPAAPTHPPRRWTQTQRRFDRVPCKWPGALPGHWSPNFRAESWGRERGPVLRREPPVWHSDLTLIDPLCLSSCLSHFIIVCGCPSYSP